MDNPAIQIESNGGEIDALFGGDDSLDNDLKAMRDDEKNESQNEDAKADAKHDVKEEKIAAEEKKAATEGTKDEEYKPEEYQHNKNYKQAMEAERREKAELKKQFAQAREENEKLKQVFEKIYKQAETPAQPIPSFEDDPIEALKYKLDQAEKKINEFDQDKLQTREQYERAASMQKFQNTYASKAREFEQQAPDFKDAYAFALKSRFEEYQALGYSQEEAVALVNEDEMAIVAKALQSEQNPAESIYKLAKMRGYQGKQAANESINNQAKQKMETLERGMNASKSLSNNGGGQANGDLTIESILAMDDDEFDKVDWEKVRKLMA